jgi:hypothetical protein
MRMRLSQTQLNQLELCPRKFQHLYLDQLGTPSSPDQQVRLDWGNRFHLLMQQRELQLPIEIASSQDDDQLLSHVNALVTAAPEVFHLSPAAFRQSEHRRSLDFNGYLLTVVYDLLILERDCAQIFDWKTYPLPQHRQWLSMHWQTRLYPFVLVETSDYKPDQVTMTYWFVQARTRDEVPTPQCLPFPYTQERHEQTRRDLTHLLSRLSHWLDQYQQGAPLPQIDEIQGHCADCLFAARCQRGAFYKAASTDEASNLADIQEVVL